MRSFRIINPLVKSRKAKTVCLAVGLLLVLLTSAYAVYTQTVNKYPTGYIIGTTDMLQGGMILEKGSVFGFNSAKSAIDTGYATIQEGACATPDTLHNFSTGKQGFVTTASGGITFSTLGTDGRLGPDGAAQTSYVKSTTARTFAWNKKFLWDCGQPTAASFSMYYKLPTWNTPFTSGNWFQVFLVKPDLTSVNLNVGGAATVSLPTGTTTLPWTPLTSVVLTPAHFNQAGIYTLRINGALDGNSNQTTDLKLRFDDVNLTVTSGYASYTQNIEFTERATPFSSLGSYLLEVRARKISGDPEATFIEVCGHSATNCTIWNRAYTVLPAQTTWNPYTGYNLSTAEYNGGNVRIRYVDEGIPAAPNDNNRGGIEVDYQRIVVNQGTCVDSVKDSESDCGKCHNYDGDVTKPWPNLGMHNLHAQSESISDCLWCHPDNGLDSAHSDGVLKVAGTKVYRVGDGAVVPGVYDNTSKQCATTDCHYNLASPAWNATYVSSGYTFPTQIARNCSRCHNYGTAGGDSATDLRLNFAWPGTTADGGGHSSHNSAVTFNDYSCQSSEAGSCHPDNRGQHTVVGDGNVVVKMAPTYGSPNTVIKYIKSSATKGDGICVNVSCHGGQATPKFNLSSTNPINMTLLTGVACAMCHVGEAANGWGFSPGNASQHNSPISGLHRGSPPTSGQDHSSGLTNQCQACHTLASLNNRHFKDAGGNTLLASWQMLPMAGASFVAANGYVQGVGTAPNYTTPPTCAVTTATCHSEGNTAYRLPATTWKRRWTWDSYADETPDLEKVKQCNGCHGHWGTFTTGVVQPHVLSNTDGTLRVNLETRHTDSGVNCGTMCHAQGATLPTAYNHGVAIGTTAKDMSLNANAGIVINATTVGCSNACHANEAAGVPDGGGFGSHVFANAPWVTTVNHTNGPTITCYQCHGGGTAQIGDAGFNFWPDGGAYPDTAGGSAPTSRHLAHITKLAPKVGGSMGSLSIQQQKTMCAFCHFYTTAPGEGGHGVLAAPADVTGTAFNPLWSTIATYPNQADTGTAAAWNTGTQQCSGIDCHNNKATAGTYAWNSNGTSACMMCHTVGGTNNPTTGLHNIVKVGPQKHDNTINANLCGACHSATIPATHINGTFTADAAANTDRFLGGLNAFTYTQTAVTAGRSGTCTTACHTDNGNWARLWSTEADSTATATSSARCNVCHGQWSSIGAGWMAGTSHFKSGGVNAATNTRTKIHDGANTCDACHVYGAAGAGRHNDAAHQINLNNNSVTTSRTGTYALNGTAGCSSGIAGCHTDGAAGPRNLPFSYFPVGSVAGALIPAPPCTGCHDSGAASAPIVSSVNGSHISANGGAFVACEQCHEKHADTTTAGPNVVYVWTTSASGAVPTMNWPYTSHLSKIRLGGTATASTTFTFNPSATTEAQMCWGCHDKFNVSEWGSNTAAKTGNITYDYGDLYTDNTGTTKTSNWTTGFWRSGKGRSSQAATNPYWYKRGAIQSTHSVNFDSGTVALTTSGNSLGFGRKENKDSVANLRCSWCHDVHGNHNTVNGDTSGGAGTLDQPYMRGSWKGNPYSEDGAPQLGMSTWALQGFYDAVPRASASPTNSGIALANSKAGGWWIDQNSNNPNSQTNVHLTSGLCEQCHGTNKTGTWNTASIGTIDYLTTGIEANNSNWVSGYNGHASSVLNGPGRGTAGTAESYARNIFTRTLRGTASGTFTKIGKANVDMGLVTETATQTGYSYRSSWVSYQYLPGVSDYSAYQAFAWGTPRSGSAGQTTKWAPGSQGLTFSTAAIEPWATTDAQANYHTFTCSKCHNPHASRLPKLMITNCLDTNHNTWEDDTTFTNATALPTLWTNTRHSQWASAQNCHRLDARAALTSGMTVNLGRGWNRVTPWLEFTSPNSTRATITPNVPVP